MRRAGVGQQVEAQAGEFLLGRGIKMGVDSGPRVWKLLSFIRVTFTLPDASAAVLEVFDVGGRKIATRNVGTLGAGSHVVALGVGERLAPGVYLLRLAQGARSLTVRSVVVR